jgi:hypothetical protein|tara:strand:+ start:1125 stop:1895 length:771 start_codon:yes stop_codon:yes gene_type:complete
MAENQYAFPTEVLSLPSKGLLYPKDSPLSKGTIDVKYMTAKEEDILTSQNLIQQGVVIDRLLDSIIATEGVKLGDLLIGDKNAIMIGTRVLGYGKDYPVTLTDPDTGDSVETEIDLTKLKNTKFDESVFKGENKFSFTLPNSKKVIEFKLLTHSDEETIDKLIQSYEKVTNVTGVSNEMTLRLKHQILSVDGVTDQKEIDNFVDNQFLALDTREFRKYVSKIQPDVDVSINYTSKVGKQHKIPIALGIDFFWPAGE